MITLVPLCTMTMTIDRAVNAGPTPTGQRLVAGISGAAVSGRLAGQMVGGGNANWFTMTADGLMLPNVRLAIQTHDEAIVLVQYSGRMRFARGQESVAFIAAVFETGDPVTSGSTASRRPVRASSRPTCVPWNTSSSSSRSAGTKPHSALAIISSWSYLPRAQPHSSRGPTAVGWRSGPAEVSSAGSTWSRGRRRSSHAGSHQLARPSMCITDGTRTVRAM